MNFYCRCEKTEPAGATGSAPASTWPSTEVKDRKKTARKLLPNVFFPFNFLTLFFLLFIYLFLIFDYFLVIYSVDSLRFDPDRLIGAGLAWRRLRWLASGRGQSQCDSAHRETSPTSLPLPWRWRSLPHYRQPTGISSFFLSLSLFFSFSLSLTSSCDVIDEWINGLMMKEWIPGRLIMNSPVSVLIMD